MLFNLTRDVIKNGTTLIFIPDNTQQIAVNRKKYPKTVRQAYIEVLNTAILILSNSNILDDSTHARLSYIYLSDSFTQDTVILHLEAILQQYEHWFAII